MSGRRPSRGLTAWEDLAAEVSEGWKVFSADDRGELTGRLAQDPAFKDGVLHLVVRWEGTSRDQQVAEPAVRRRLWRLNSTIVISSTDGMLTLEPAAG